MNETTPLISVIVPVYNVEQFLPACVESIINQTYRDLEIILVDDGSPDKSGEICDAYAQKDGRIKVIHKENGGLSSARNAGLDVCCGTYVSFIDSDDWIEPNAYELLCAAIQGHNADIASCGRYIAYEEENEALFVLPERIAFDGKEAMRRILTFDAMDTSFCDKLFARKLFDGIRFPVGMICEDTYIIGRVCARAERVVHVGVPLYYWRTRRGSISRSKVSQKSFDVLTSAAELKSLVMETYPALEREADAFYLRAVIYLLAAIADARSKEFGERKKELRRILRKRIFAICRNKCIARSYRVKALLLFLHLYRPVCALVRGLRK